jgi:hypothetical protein
MKPSIYIRTFSAVVAAALMALPAFAQDKEKKEADKKPDDGAMMAMMMELAKPGDNHKLLGEGAGNWSYKVKAWMSLDAPPSEGSGTSVGRSVLGGRYLVTDHMGKFQMPGPDGKMMDMDFKGMALEGYDNVKKKFVASWVDNMGTGIMNSEGTYDASTKTLTYTSEYEPMPGMKMKVRQVMKFTDKDHRSMEFFEVRGDKEVKTMEINYLRKG